MEHFGTLSDIPYGRVDLGKECICVLDHCVYMGHDQTVCVLHGLSIDLSATDYEASARSGLSIGRQSRKSGLISLFQRYHNIYPFQSGKAAGNDDIRAFWERSADGLECLSAHDYRTSRCCPLEELQIIGNMP